MTKIFFTKEHEWISISDNIATVGITIYAQEQLGDVVFIELPEIGSHVIQGKEIAIVESVKAASEVYSPLTGEVLEVNKILNESPNMVNEDAEGKGWFIKLKVENISELNKLMEPESYKKYIEEGG